MIRDCRVNARKDDSEYAVAVRRTNGNVLVVKFRKSGVAALTLAKTATINAVIARRSRGNLSVS
jgi:hypothetical protein